MKEFTTYLEEASNKLILYHGTDLEGLLKIMKTGKVSMSTNSEGQRSLFFFSFPSHYGDVQIKVDATNWPRKEKENMLIANAEIAGYEIFADEGFEEIEDADGVRALSDTDLNEILHGELELMYNKDLPVEKIMGIEIKGAK